MACAVAEPDPRGDFPAWLATRGMKPTFADAMERELGISDYEELLACAEDAQVTAELLGAARDRLPFAFYAVLRRLVRALAPRQRQRWWWRQRRRGRRRSRGPLSGDGEDDGDGKEERARDDDGGDEEEEDDEELGGCAPRCEGVLASRAVLDAIVATLSSLSRELLQSAQRFRCLDSLVHGDSAVGPSEGGGSPYLNTTTMSEEVEVAESFEAEAFHHEESVKMSENEAGGRHMGQEWGEGMAPAVEECGEDLADDAREGVVAMETHGVPGTGGRCCSSSSGGGSSHWEKATTVKTEKFYNESDRQRRNSLRGSPRPSRHSSHGPTPPPPPQPPQQQPPQQPPQQQPPQQTPPPPVPPLTADWHHHHHHPASAEPSRLLARSGEGPYGHVHHHHHHEHAAATAAAASYHPLGPGEDTGAIHGAGDAPPPGTELVQTGDKRGNVGGIGGVSSVFTRNCFPDEAYAFHPINVVGFCTEATLLPPKPSIYSLGCGQMDGAAPPPSSSGLNGGACQPLPKAPPRRQDGLGGAQDPGSVTQPPPVAGGPASARTSFVCVECGRCFASATLRRVHQRREHSAERPFHCDMCGKRYTQAWLLARHARSHTGERPFACADCGRRFSQAWILERHKRTVRHHRHSGGGGGGVGGGSGVTVEPVPPGLQLT
ncbi:zinc finger protein 746-like [Lethenteron reissneri]|uniref:zinc finger protein 746-like n=1 Tax=Lethenteron reissneri TaxID=7753 RepID=UPI002AB7C765|nr:zinc finger protein 746-like [Lethenteron reissneri]XP_061419039.1 zinc finger protein 746-like [Lethenteron reissneri]